MMMRVKAVTITSRLGASDSTVTSAVNWMIRLVAPGSPAAPRSMLTDCAWPCAGQSSAAATRIAVSSSRPRGLFLALRYRGLAPGGRRWR